MAKREQEPDPLAQVFLHAFPNPERVGCPGGSILRALARKQLPTDHPAFTHVGECSPCFQELRVYQVQWDKTKIRRRLLAVACFVAAISAGGMYLILRQPWIDRQMPWLARNTPIPDRRRTPPPSTGPDDSGFVLNLLGISENRGTNTPNDIPASGLQYLPRRRISPLTIFLKKFSEPGLYEVRLLTRPESQTALAIFTGMAQIEQGLTVLRLSADLSLVQPGTYTIAVRHDRESWHNFTVQIP